MSSCKRVKQIVIRIVSDEYLDLYILAGAALTFTVLGFVGVADIKVLASATIALLAVLAYSQIQSRRHVADIAKDYRSDPLSIFQTEFPDDLDKRRVSASNILLIGMSLGRTVRGGWLRQILRSGGKIRVLVLDPTNELLVRAASEHKLHSLTTARLTQRIQTTLDELAEVEDAADGNVEVRVASFIPHIGIDAYDINAPEGIIVVQHYEHKPVGESAPIFTLKPTDGAWYKHFAAEAERMWEDGTPWPLSPTEALRRSARLPFEEEFGPQLELTMGKARELLITGFTRNGLINSKYNKVEDWLKNGCHIRILLVEPSSEAVVAAAGRYYAERSPDTARERIRQSLRLLAELKRSTSGDLSVRLTPHPLAMGVIAVDGNPDTRSEASALFVEYYLYRAPGVEPKFVLQPADDRWFDSLYQEAEALWADAGEYKLLQ